MREQPTLLSADLYVERTVPALYRKQGRCYSPILTIFMTGVVMNTIFIGLLPEAEGLVLVVFRDVGRLAMPASRSLAAWVAAGSCVPAFPAGVRARNMASLSPPTQREDGVRG